MKMDRPMFLTLHGHKLLPIIQVCESVENKAFFVRVDRILSVESYGKTGNSIVTLEDVENGPNNIVNHIMFVAEETTDEIADLMRRVYK